MNTKLPRIYAITDSQISGISHAEQVERLIDGGLRLIQLREKEASSREFYEAAERAVSMARKCGAKIIINDRVDIAMAVGADGVHLGQDDLNPRLARKLLGSRAIVGFSTHSLEQARRATRYPIDYIAIGPVFPTKTKLNPDPVIGIETLRAVRQAIGALPLVGIGGIDLSNLKSVYGAGADSVALVSGLISRADKISEMAKSYIYQADSLD